VEPLGGYLLNHTLGIDHDTDQQPNG